MLESIRRLINANLELESENRALRAQVAQKIPLEGQMVPLPIPCLLHIDKFRSCTIVLYCESPALYTNELSL